jgi:alkaline phosphatase D
MKPLLFLIAVSAITHGGRPCVAQHDPQRDATRFVAAGQYEKAEKELSSAAATEPETHFVRMLSALRQGQVKEAAGHAKTALDSGMPFERLVAGPRDVLAPLYETDDFGGWQQKYKPGSLIHGPMVGSVTDSGASFWIRTAQESKFAVRVYPMDGDFPLAISRLAMTTIANDLTGVAVVEGLEPGTRYRYAIEIDSSLYVMDKPTFRTSPKQHSAAEFSVGFGGGAGYVPEWEYMWDTISKADPHAFLMLGDNVYIDDPEHDLTMKYCYYRRQSRPEWRRFTSSRSIYSIYDDHDFATNDCVPGPEIDQPSWKRPVWNVFRQNWVNPAYGGGEKQPGCWYDFYIGDVHFIMLDGRYYRTREPEPSMLGPVQKQWLKETLSASKGTFKVLASPVPFTENIKPGSKDPWDGFAKEREEIFSYIESQKINGVFLIAADRHRTDLRITSRKNGYDLYEFESSKLTNRHTHPVVKTPGLVWGHSKTCSYALMKFNTKAIDPTVRFEAITIDGEVLHTHDLNLSTVTNNKP